MASRLRNVVVKFVSIVDRGAGVGANVALYKRDDEGSPDSELLTLTKMQPDSSSVHVPTPLGSKGDKQKSKKGKKKGKGKKKMPDFMLDKRDDTSDGDGSHTLTHQSTTEETIVGKKNSSTEDVDLAKMDHEELVKYAESLETIVVDQAALLEDGDLDEDITKLDDETIERIEKAEARAKRAEKVAKAERQARLAKRFEDEATELTGLSVEPEELATTLAKLHEADEELYDTVHGILSKASTALSSALFEEVGKSSGNGVSSTLEAKTAEIRKSDPELSEQQAMAKALEQDPSLYEADNDGGA